MDAYDEVSDARRGPDEPDGSASIGPTGEVSDGERGGLGASASTPASAPTSASASASTSESEPTPAAASHTPAGAPAPRHPSPSAPAQSASGIAALPLPYQIAVALVLAVVAVVACVHVGMVFLHVAPSNTLTKQHGQAVDEWVYPEFEQNWKLFAPNPLQQNIAVQVRAEVRDPGGGVRETGWYDLSALDGADIDGNPMPSHTQQNELRRAWDFYVSTHDNENRATSSRGELSERYLRRIVVMRLDRELDRQQPDGSGGVVERIQVRSRTTNVPAPEWSEEQVSDKPVIRELSWWSVTDRDRTDHTDRTDRTDKTDRTDRTEASAE